MKQHPVETLVYELKAAYARLATNPNAREQFETEAQAAFARLPDPDTDAPAPDAPASEPATPTTEPAPAPESAP